MKLADIKQKITGCFDLLESLNSTAKITWIKDSDFSERGSFIIDDVEYIINVDCIAYKNFNFIEVGFTADLGDGHTFKLTSQGNNASKILGIVKNAALDKIKHYEDAFYVNGVLLGVNNSHHDDAEVASTRFRIYERIARSISQKFGYGMNTIPLPNGAGNYILLKNGNVSQEIEKEVARIAAKN